MKYEQYIELVTPHNNNLNLFAKKIDAYDAGQLSNEEMFVEVEKAIKDCKQAHKILFQAAFDSDLSITEMVETVREMERMTELYMSLTQDLKALNVKFH
jgi:hypothetical protein